LQCINKKCAADIPDDALYCPRCGRKQTRESNKRVKRPNGTGSVYKLSGRRRRPWVAAKNGIIIGYYITKTDALEAVNALAKRPITERYNMTFKEVFEAWKLEHYRDLTDDGRYGYELAYKQFETLYDLQFRSLRTDHFQREIDKYAAKGRTHSSTSKLKQLIGQMSKWAVREEIATTNYAQFLKLPEEKKVEKEIFSDEDIKKLKKCKNDAAKIVLMLIFTGMRIGELFDMPAENVYDTYCIGGEKTEAGKNRIIPIPTDVRKHFAYFKSRTGEGERLLDGYSGNSDVKNFRRRDYYELLDELQITRKTPHSTRHTYASKAVKAGMPPELLQKILGHADYSTTANIYVHTDIDALVKAAENLTAQKKSQ